MGVHNLKWGFTVPSIDGTRVLCEPHTTCNLHYFLVVINVSLTGIRMYVYRSAPTKSHKPLSGEI